MKLENNINYIISGLERSGTSMLMQILKSGGASVAFDNSRLIDENNPKGYYELAGGKIINKLMDKSFPFNDFKGQFIKITAYGINFLPNGKYKIIYSERNIEEVLDSMEKMAKIKDESREETKESFVKLNVMIKNILRERGDVEVLFVNYNKIISNPESEIKKIYDFLGNSDINLEKMIEAVDSKLYRQRRIKK